MAGFPVLDIVKNGYSLSSENSYIHQETSWSLCNTYNTLPAEITKQEKRVSTVYVYLVLVMGRNAFGRIVLRDKGGLRSVRI